MTNMKKGILWIFFALGCIAGAYGQNRIIPPADGDGGIGRDDRYWGESFIEELNLRVPLAVESGGTGLNRALTLGDIEDTSLLVRMTADERGKLAAIAEGAEVNLVTSVAGDTGDVTLDAADIAETDTLKILTADERTKLTSLYAAFSGRVIDMDKEGCVADDTTDNFSTIRTAIQSGAGKTLQFGDGTYKLVVDATAIGTLPSGITIRGTGKDKTVLRFAKTTATYLNLMTFSSSNNIVFEDLTLQCDYDDTISGNFFSVVSFSNVRFTRCKLIGQSGTTTANDKVYLFSLNKNANTRTGFLMEYCDVYGWVYVFLKTNDAVSVDYNYTLSHCTFEDNITGNINFNSPLGETVGFVVDNCKIYTAGPYLAGTGHLIAFAGVEDLRITNNALYGESDWEAIHLENINQRCIIANNSIKVASFWSNDTAHDLYGTGIWVNRNTTIGRMGAMDYLAITGNLIERYYTNSETALSGTGISLAIDADPTTKPAENVIISGNVIRNFKNGFEIEVPADESIWITGNIIIDCTAGVRTDIDQSYFGSNKWVNCGSYTPENWEEAL